MKKIALVIAITSMLIVGCSKEDSVKSLKGKYYSGFSHTTTERTYQGVVIIPSYDVYRSLIFVDEASVEITSNENNPKGKIIGEIEVAKYVLDYPNLKIQKKDGAILSGHFISDDTFRMEGMNYNLIK